MSKRLLKFGNGSLSIVEIVTQADAALARIEILRNGGLVEASPALALDLDATYLNFNYHRSDN
jgi:hypothetical protein